MKILMREARAFIYTKFINALGIAIALSLLTAAIPALPALAAYDIEIDPEEGKIGDEITITGSGFSPSTENTEKWATVYFAKDEANVNDDIGIEVETYEEVETELIGYLDESDEGEFETTFDIPAELIDGSDDEDVASGIYYIYVTVTTAPTLIKSVAEFTVVVNDGVNAKQLTSTIEFNKVSLSSIANHPYHLGETLGADSYSYNDIPFLIEKVVFMTQYGAAQLPVDRSLETEIPNPQSVHVLINSTETHLQFLGKQVGIITLVFDNGETETTELVVGQNVREYILDSPTVTVNTISSASNQEVWRGVSPDGRKPMIIDMLIITVGLSNQNRTLKRIDFTDTSASQTGSTSPGLLVWALTVKYKVLAEPSEAPVVEKVIPPAPEPESEFRIPLLWVTIIAAVIILFIVFMLILKRRSRPHPPKPEPPPPPGPVTRTIYSLPPELEDLYYDASFIGSGGFAKVFRARRRKDDTEVAVKIPISLDASTGKSFVREITSWQNLNHRNIVKLYDLNILPIPFLEMELCDSNLDNLNKPLDIEQAAQLIFDIAEGLKHAHSKDIIHRDLKPANILLDDDIPKIADWGLSKIAKDSKSSVRSSFTVLYAAPEQLSPDKFGKTDNRTDIYQLGAIFYELLTGKPPSQGDNATEIIAQIIMGKPKPPSEHNPKAKTIEPIIMKCLEKEMGQRYQNVDQMQKDLAEYLKIEYQESLGKSQGNMKRSSYYCSELCMVHLQMGDIVSAVKYAIDLKNYTTKKETKDMLTKLIDELEYRQKEGIIVPEELVERASVVVHQVKMGW